MDKQLLDDNYIINCHSSTLFGLSIDKSGVQYKLFIKCGDGEPILLKHGTSDDDALMRPDITAELLNDNEIYGTNYIPFQLMKDTKCWLELSEPADVYEYTINVDDPQYIEQRTHNITLFHTLYTVENGTFKKSNKSLFNYSFVDVNDTEEYKNFYNSLLNKTYTGNATKDPALWDSLNGNNKALYIYSISNLDTVGFKEQMNTDEAIYRAGDIFHGFKLSKPGVEYELVCGDRAILSGTSTDEPVMFGQTIMKFNGDNIIEGANYLPMIALAFNEIHIKTDEPMEVTVYLSHSSHYLRRYMSMTPHEIDFFGKQLSISSGMLH
jgi:hypothetical protein